MTAPDLGKHTEGLIGYECSPPPLAALYNQVTKGATNNGGPGYYFRKRFNANCEKKAKEFLLTDDIYNRTKYHAAKTERFAAGKNKDVL